jgi:hypothetical protein
MGYVKILLDITEKKKSEDAIKKYIKELEDLNMHKESVARDLVTRPEEPAGGDHRPRNTSNRISIP